MQIHELKLAPRKDKKKIGRGGKRGTYSGRGNKGQKARSGGNVDPLFEGGRSSLIERLKKLRGFKTIKMKKNNLGLNDLERKFSDGETVSVETLIKVKILDKTRAKNGVKILGAGILTKRLSVAGDILLSASAKEAIEKAGGSIVEVINSKKQVTDKKQ